MRLSEEEILIVINELKTQKISNCPLEGEIIDHICTKIEEDVKISNLPFNVALKKAVASFQELKQLQHDLTSQVYGKYLSFQRFLIFSLTTAIIGLLLKLFILPFANIAIVLSCLSVILPAIRLGYLMIKDYSFRKYRIIIGFFFALLFLIAYSVTKSFNNLEYKIIVALLLLYQVGVIYHYYKNNHSKAKVLAIISCFNFCFLLFDYIELIGLININLSLLYLTIIVFQGLIFFPIMIVSRIHKNLIITTGMLLISIYCFIQLTITLNL